MRMAVRRLRADRVLLVLVAVAAAMLAAFATDVLGARHRASEAREGGRGIATASQSPPRASQAIDPALFRELHYRAIGPHRGGRVTAVEGIPDQPSTFYMGGTGGGVFKTTDSGQNWENISDGFFATGSIGAIRIAPSNPNVVYVGTGSSGLRSNVITGKGVYKSTDAGRTWTHIGLAGVGQIGRMAVHPTNPDVVYVAAIGDPFAAGPDRGVYKTTDGGRTWQKVLFISNGVGVYGLVMEPGNPDVLYASGWRAERKPWTIISGNEARDGGGIYKSTDGGETWDKLSNGLPQGLIGKIDLSISPAKPDRVYALVEAPEPEEGVYRSDDRGESWTLVNGNNNLMRRPFYYTDIDADPTNADTVYVMNEGFFKSTNAGVTFQQRSTPHGDNHDMWINPNDPNIFIEANDGGVNVTLNGGATWSTQNNQNTAELYQIDVDDRFPYRVCAGQQDASTICVPSLPPGRHAAAGQETGWWQSVSGCETGPAVPKPGDPETVYGNCKGEFSVYDFRTGQEANYWVGAYYMYGHAARDLPNRFQRVSPIEVSPHDPNVIYHASQYIYRTTNGGKVWDRISDDLTARPPGTQGLSGEPITRDITGEEFYSTIYAVEESPLREGVIWVGANDGPFHVTRDGGRRWRNVTPDGLPPGGRVQNIEPSPHDPGRAYFAVYRYLLGDYRPYIYRTDDYGRSWTLLTDGRNGIPADCPTRVVREDPERGGLLYAGTECGMWVSFDDGARWQPLQLDLPMTPVTDIELIQDDLVVSTMGRGFWILDDPAPLRQASEEVARASAHLFQPTDAYRMRYPATGGGPGEPEYPPPGAYVDYYLAQDQAGPVTLEILDAGGDVIRRFSSEPPAVPPPPPDDPRDIPPLEGAATPRLNKTAGMHRVRWDLSRAGVWDADAGDSGENGPTTAPGTYRARLTVGSVRQTRTFAIKIDPRIAQQGVTQADLDEQLLLNERIRDALSQAKLTLARIQRAEQALEGKTGPIADRARRRLAALKATIQTDPNEPSYPQPMLIDQIDYLYGMTDSADQQLGHDAFERYRQLRAQVDDAIAELLRILGRCGSLCDATAPVTQAHR
jgi:photosystem II stability/assembly factor-like uncharacterized protein